ncbi:SMR family transporter [Cobetia sp. 10Alg 146]|uniref:DMT family transporter n=1 Tax=Cobetia sp. 10Alg 146 TaxID=3040019 RepID=UPI0024485B1D|nr:SMR family transporter [Cobetia sp. 10Alg 146]MDH2290076.1 SMR family transporter [Cobetia sp. 10Alg 146]
MRITLYFLISTLCEIGWATGLKVADTPLEWALTVLLVIISLSLVTQIARTLPASTTYAIFVGLGTLGTVVTDLLFFELEFQWSTLGFVVLMLIGIIVLKTAPGAPADKRTRASATPQTTVSE